jgi:hypothetical protein
MNDLFLKPERGGMMWSTNPVWLMLALMCGLVACDADSAGNAALFAPLATAAPLPESASGDGVAELMAQTVVPQNGQRQSARTQAGGSPELDAPQTERVLQTGDSATRCTRVAGLMVEDAGRMMRWLGAGADESVAFRLHVGTSLGSSFQQRCQTLTSEQLSCLETSENAISGIAECAVNATRDFSTWLELPPTLDQRMPWEQADPATLDPVGAETLAASLVGHWQAQSGTRSWTFRGDGTFQEVNGSATEGRYVVSGRARVNLEYPGMNRPDVYSAIVDGDTLHIKPYPGGTAQPIIDGQHALVTHMGIWRLDELNASPRCSGFSSRAQPVQSARCNWDMLGPHRLLVVTANPGPDPLFGTAGAEVRLEFLELSGHLVPRVGADLYVRAASDLTPAP